MKEDENEPGWVLLDWWDGPCSYNTCAGVSVMASVRRRRSKGCHSVSSKCRQYRAFPAAIATAHLCVFA